VVLKLKDAYGVWQDCLSSFPKAHRFTIGSKIDTLFLDAIEHAFVASYTNVAEKQPHINISIVKVDLIKLLLQLAWEIKAIDNNRYMALSGNFAEIGKMLGGWKRQLINKTPADKPQEKR